MRQEKRLDQIRRHASSGRQDHPNATKGPAIRRALHILDEQDAACYGARIRTGLGKQLSRNIALIGCGAISQQFYSEALARLRSEFDRVWLIDPGIDALNLVRSKVPSAHTASRIADVDDELFATIVATPNNLHLPLALEALSRGSHVLIEKPFVLAPEDGEALLKHAVMCDRLVAVNQTRRFFPYAKELHRRISEGEFGALRSASHAEGTKFNWPFASGAAFASDARRTGAVMDFGVHIIDFYHFLIKPVWRVLHAVHDGFAGPEGLAELRLSADDAPIDIRISRFYPQSNVAKLSFDLADVQIKIFEPDKYWVCRKGNSEHEYRAARDTTFHDLATAVVSNFISAAAGHTAAVCDGASSLPVISVLDQVYRSATHYPEEIGAV